MHDHAHKTNITRKENDGMFLKFHWRRTLLIVIAVSLLSLTFSAQASAAKPGYEPVFYNGGVYTVNIIEVPNVASSHALADFYQVVYPIGWQTMGIGTPQCNPCDHDGGGIDFIDYHDHVLDSVPSSPGHGEFSPLWKVFVVLPNYTGDATHNALVNAAYAAHIPTKSEAAVDDLLAAKLSDGSPVALEIDIHHYFICAVVGHA
jgi:hypothetical protein